MAQPEVQFNVLCRLIDVANPETVRATLPKLFSKRNLEREPVARRIGAFMDWRKRGGFALLGVAKEDARQLDAEIRFPVTQDHWRVRIILADDGSGLIDEMLMGRAPLPKRDLALTDQQIADEFIGYVTHLGQNDLFSGAVLIGRHGRILGQTATGFASREHGVRNTPETLFNIASLTKSWTAVAVVQLIEQGHFALKTPVAQLLTLDGVDLDPRIEIRHLLSHTSGLGDYFGKPFNSRPRDKVRSLDDFLDMATTFEPAFPPGTDWSYSNIGMMLLGKIIAQAHGTSYYAALADQVFRPAGMKTAFFPQLDEVHQGCASGYGQRWTDDGPVTINALHSWAVRGAADGCAFATLQDIWAFVAAFKEGRLVSSKWAQQMTSAKPELGSLDYGYGFALLPESAVVGHSGGLIGASANLDMTNNPDGWTIIVLANDLSMRTPVIKARQMVGVTIQERDDAKTNMPRAGLTAR